MSPTRAFIALGSNLGDRERWLATAVSRLATVPGLRVLAETAPMATPPLGGLAQPDYLNAMVLVTWSGDAESLLATCQQIEQETGRHRATRWASRELDLDLVRFGTMLCDRPALTLPHPGLRDRPFWMRQVAELEHHA